MAKDSKKDPREEAMEKMLANKKCKNCGKMKKECKCDD